MPVGWSSDGSAGALVAVSDLWIYRRDVSDSFRVDGLGVLRAIGDGRALASIGLAEPD